MESFQTYLILVSQNQNGDIAMFQQVPELL